MTACTERHLLEVADDAARKGQKGMPKEAQP